MSRTAVQRRAVRRAARTRCQAVEVAGFSLLAEQVVDLSPHGMLLECVRRTQVGSEILVSFRAPGDDQDELWFDAEAIVTRVIAGRRWSDDGYGAGIEFTYFEKSCRHELLARLMRCPVSVPKFRGAAPSFWRRGSFWRGKTLNIPRGTFGVY